MGYGPSHELQTTLNVVDLNITYFLHAAEPGQLCPLAAWAAYWTMRTHSIPVTRCARPLQHLLLDSTKHTVQTGWKPPAQCAWLNPAMTCSRPCSAIGCCGGSTCAVVVNSNHLPTC